MLTEHEIIGRFEHLIEQLSAVPATSGMYSYDHGHSETIVRVSTSALNLIGLAFGRDSVHAARLSATIDSDKARRTPATLYRGLIASAKDDFEAGYYRNLRELIAGEVFDDLLQMAEHLHHNAYHLAAASIAGAVLEDSLRRICDARALDRSHCRAINALNQRLRESDVYSQAQWRQVQAWGDLRNQVDHHQFQHPSEVDANDVRRMIEGVRDLIVRYLG